MKLMVVTAVFFFFGTSFANSNRDLIEEKIVADLAQTLKSFDSPNKALDKLRPRLSEEETKYFERLIAEKEWVEMPQVESYKKTLKLTYSNGDVLSLVIENYWSGKYSVNGYALQIDRYSNIKDRFAYLRRVIQNHGSPKKSASVLWNILFPSAQASLTCNALMSSGCLEVSMAASLWLVREASEESPLARCKNIYYYNKNDDITKKCMTEFKNSPTLQTIQGISEVLAEAPGSTVEITCNKSEGPDIWINGAEVTRLGKGHDARDYSIGMEQDKNLRLQKLPELAIRCCKRQSSDPLAGQCEEFVNNHLGSNKKRAQEFKNPDLRIRGKTIRGVQ